MRGLGPHAGSFDKSAQQDVIDADAFEGPITLLSGSADALPPHVGGNFVVSTAGVDAMTLGAPTAGTDDNLTLAVYSDTTNAHTITATALLANGTALKTTATFAVFRGAGLTLRAYNGVWQVVGSTGVTFT